MNRRGFLAGLATALAAPAVVVRSGLVMPLRGIVMPIAPPPRMLWIEPAVGGYMYSDDLADILREQVLELEVFKGQLGRYDGVRIIG